MTCPLHSVSPSPMRFTNTVRLLVSGSKELTVMGWNHRNEGTLPQGRTLVHV